MYIQGKTTRSISFSDQNFPCQSFQVSLYSFNAVVVLLLYQYFLLVYSLTFFFFLIQMFLTRSKKGPKCFTGRFLHKLHSLHYGIRKKTYHKRYQVSKAYHQLNLLLHTLIYFSYPKHILQLIQQDLLSSFYISTFKFFFHLSILRQPLILPFPLLPFITYPYQLPFFSVFPQASLLTFTLSQLHSYYYLCQGSNL